VGVLIGEAAKLPLPTTHSPASRPGGAAADCVVGCDRTNTNASFGTQVEQELQRKERCGPKGAETEKLRLDL
jgi:hypothetical protein